MRKFFPLMVLLFMGIALSTPALFGINILSNKEAYVENETVRIMCSVFYSLETPAYLSNVSIHVYDPEGKSFFNSSCLTNENGVCYVNFTIKGVRGDWTINASTELSGASVGNSIIINLHEEVCGDGICDINEPSHCEVDCGKADGEKCSSNNECYSEICCNGICREECPFCGDGICEGECPLDCGEEVEEIVGGSGLISPSIGMRIYSQKNLSAEEGSYAEWNIIVENLINSTQKEVHLYVNGFPNYTSFPNMTNIPPQSNQTFALSVPIFGGDKSRSFKIIALSNSSISNIVELFVRVEKPQKTTKCSLNMCDSESECCESYVCCNGKCEKICPICGNGICEKGENCLCSDCGGCKNALIKGNRDMAEKAIGEAEKAINSTFVIIFKSMVVEAKTDLKRAKEFFIDLEYDKAEEMAESSITKTRNACFYEIGSYCVGGVLLAIIFNKLYKQGRRKEKHGRNKNKEKSKD